MFFFLLQTANFNCNFDTNFCGWTQDHQTDNFDWLRYRGSTQSSGTGPSKDHTSGSKYSRNLLL